MRATTDIESGVSRAVRGRVLRIHSDGSAVVVCEEGRRTGVACDLLRTSDASPLSLKAGDDVLVWHSDRKEVRAVVLGRIERKGDLAAPREAPEELVLEAKRNLTLKVGDGSITIREDGKILIKGKDLVSHAKRMNRIKGGAVSIN